MSPEQIREIVRATVEELIKQRALEGDNYKRIMQELNDRLYKYFAGAKDNELRKVLLQLSDDPYIDIIYLIYRDRKTIEWIADRMERDESTIKRNKKRLIMSIYRELELF